MQKKYRVIRDLKSEIVIAANGFNDDPKLGAINLSFAIPSLYPHDTFNGFAVGALFYLSDLLGDTFDEEVSKKSEAMFHLFKMLEEDKGTNNKTIKEVVDSIFAMENSTDEYYKQFNNYIELINFELGIQD